MKLFHWLALTTISLVIAQLTGCVSEDIAEILDFDERYAEDVRIIQDYIAEKGWEPVDSTESGVRYFVQDTGSGPNIEYRDIVTLEFTGRTTNDVAFRTTYQEVVDADSTDNLTFASDPLIFTHSPGGWLLEENFEIEDGFSEGIAVLLDTLNVHGVGFIAIPSRLGFGSISFNSVPANSVLVYEISPINVRK